MTISSIAISISIACLALGVDGNDVDFFYIIFSAISFLLFFVTIRHRETNLVGRDQRGSVVDFSIISTALFSLFAIFSSFYVLSHSGMFMPIFGVGSFLLMPVGYLLFRYLNYSKEIWENLDITNVCVNSSLLFCGVLVAGNTEAFANSVLGSYRFTWAEFRSVNPLPLLAAMLLVWRGGIRALLDWRLAVLVIFVYATKYTNWMVLLILAIPLAFAVKRFHWMSASSILLSLILIINTFIFVNWIDVSRIDSSEYRRVYEIFISYTYFLDNPIFGVGFGHGINEVEYSGFTIHNLVAYVLFSGGLVGLVLFSLSVISLSRKYGGASDFLIVVYLVLTLTAASYKLPAFQLYLGFAFAGLAALGRAHDNASRSSGGGGAR